MNSRNLVPVHQLAKKQGAKILLFGPPGTAKTPLVMQIPNAVACITETGLSSVQNVRYKTPSAFCPDFKKVDEFFKWFCNPNSKDVYQFSTLIIDSITKLCDIVLKYQQTRNKDGRAAYGEMATYVLNIVNYLQNMDRMNVIFVSQMISEQRPMPGCVPLPGQPMPTEAYNVPLFPGRVLSEKIPHDIDELLYIDRTTLPNGQYGPAIFTVDTGVGMCRSRCGKLQPLEFPDLNAIINKINS